MAAQAYTEITMQNPRHLSVAAPFARHTPSLIAIGISLASSLPAYSQEQGERLVLEEVVVSAQRRVESVQDIPLAVTYVDGDRLVNEGVQNILELQSLVPNLQISIAAGMPRIYIRGIGLTSFAMGSEPSVAFHVDGAVISRPSAQVSSFFDIARVEVLRGPQGSLYGRNATGGSINVHTKRPTDSLEGYANVQAGNYGLTDLEAAVGGPLVEGQLEGRAAVKIRKRDGYGENQFDGRDIDNEDLSAARLGLSYVGSDSFDAFLSYTHFETDAAGDYHYIGQARPDITPPEIAQGGQPADDIRDNNSENLIGGSKDLDSVTLQMNWHLSDSMTLGSITNYLDYVRNAKTDLNGTPVQFYANNQFESSEQYSQEFQLTWDGERHSTLFGLYYFHEDIDASITIEGPPPFTNVFMRPFLQFQGQQESDSYAAFWNTTWNLNERWALNTGLRYSRDSKQDVGTRTIPTGLVFPIARDENWDAWTPTVGIEYVVSDDVMLYAKASEGYKTGVMNIGNNSPAVDPEYVLSFEAGIKSQWYDNRFQVNAAVFDSTIEDMQVQRPVDGNLITVNAAEADIWGVEVETVALLAESLTLRFNASYLDATFAEFITSNTTFTPGVLEDLAGNPLPNAPETQLDVSLEHVAELGSFDIETRLQVVYTDERWFNEFQEDIAYQEATTVVNANALFRFANGDWTLNMWGRNLTDETIISHVNVTSSAIGHARLATLMPPRTYGVTIGYNF
jgi:iron complex outermembrane receptor protein